MPFSLLHPPLVLFQKVLDGFFQQDAQRLVSINGKMLQFLLWNLHQHLVEKIFFSPIAKILQP
jgi:hypothetical protein